jgi:hypothetical protein
MEQAIAPVVEFKAQLLIGLGAAVFFGLFMFLCEPLIRWLTRDEADRLILSDARRPSTYVLMGLGFGGLITAYMVLEELRVTRLVFVLNIVAIAALAMLGRLQAKRLARRLLDLRGPLA